MEQGTTAPVSLLQPLLLSPTCCSCFLCCQAQRHAHPHIIRVVAYCREALAILLERCDTTLEARVKALRGQSQPQQHHQQPEQQQQQECQWQVWLGVLSQLASAVCHLHSEGCLLLHNDLKAANVLLQGVSTGTDSTSWQLKVADFGLACKAESAHSVAGLQVPVSISHNPLWLAPELMVEGGVATLAADIYSLGRPWGCEKGPSLQTSQRCLAYLCRLPAVCQHSGACAYLILVIIQHPNRH